MGTTDVAATGLQSQARQTHGCRACGCASSPGMSRQRGADGCHAAARADHSASKYLKKELHLPKQASSGGLARNLSSLKSRFATSRKEGRA